MRQRGGSAEDMYYSIHRLIRLIPAHVRVFPGHSFGDPPGKEMSYLYKEICISKSMTSIIL